MFSKNMWKTIIDFIIKLSLADFFLLNMLASCYTLDTHVISHISGEFFNLL